MGLLPPADTLDFSFLRERHDHGAILDQEALDWLLCCRVTPLVIGSPWAVRAGRVTFTPDGRYEPNPVGDFTFFIGVRTVDEDVDHVAWQPRAGWLATKSLTALEGRLEPIPHAEIGDDAFLSGRGRRSRRCCSAARLSPLKGAS